MVPPAAAGRCRHSTQSLSSIHCDSLGIYRLILLLFSVKMMVSSVAIAAAGGEFILVPPHVYFIRDPFVIFGIQSYIQNKHPHVYQNK